MSIFRTLMSKPWTEQGAPDEVSTADAALPSSKVMLWTFLAVITSFFGLFMSAYHMRADYDDWVVLQDPPLLWLNTVALILASVAFQFATNAARDGKLDTVRLGLTAGGLLTLGFLVGQYFAWQELRAQGFYLLANSSYAFFYLLTALHGLHLLGGLYVWARTTFKVWRGFDQDDVRAVGRVRLSVELCTTYWHYLLFVWIVLFGLLLTT